MLDSSHVSSLSQVAVLVRTNRSLEYVTSKIGLPYRVFSDDPLSAVNSKNSKIMRALISYRLDNKVLVSDIINLSLLQDSFTRIQKQTTRSLIRTLRNCDDDDAEQAIISVTERLSEDNIMDSERLALVRVLENENNLKHYKPVDKNEVQIMTLHKGKGLEFEVVFHLDMYDWIFPRRVYTGDFSEEVFSDWEQDLNLHYVGITRAKEYCILVSSNQRINFNGETKKGVESQFKKLPGLDGLFK